MPENFCYSISEIGSREINEDAYSVFEQDDKKIYIVADGCGGHSSGEIASSLVVRELPKLFEDMDASEESIINAIKLCNVKIRENQKKYPGMRTTVVGLLIYSDKAFAFNVGDSRLYQIRDGKIIFHTEDHSVPYLLYKADIINWREINTHEDRNKLLEALGNKETTKVRVYPIDYSKEDIFVISTDGFWENLYDEDFNTCSRGNAKLWLEEKKEKIKSLNDPEQDNYTALIVGVKHE